MISSVSCKRTQEREATIPQRVSAGAVVDETHQLIPELGMPQESIGHVTCQITTAGNQDSFQAHAGAKATLDEGPDGLARGIGQRDIKDAEQPPHDARHLIRTLFPREVASVVDLKIERAQNADHNQQHSTDEDGKEVVNSCAVVTQAIRALQVERQRRQEADKRHEHEILCEGWLAFGRVEQTGVEPHGVCDRKRRHGEQGVKDDVAHDQ